MTGNSKQATFLLKVILIALWIQPSVLLSQEPSIVSPTMFQRIDVLVSGDINSNSVTNSFVNSLYSKNYIDNEAKAKVIVNTDEKNRLGGATKIGFSYSFQIDKSKPIVSLSLFDRMNLDCRFSDDLFGLLFFGNKPYAGKTAFAGGLKYNYLRYQQLSLGWKWEKDSSSVSYGFSASLLNGQRNSSIRWERANIYTEENGEYIDVAVLMHSNQTNALKKNFLSHNGIGISTDFFYKRPFTLFKKKSILHIEINDLGLIRWNNRSLSRRADSTYHYEGQLVSSIFDLDSISSSKNVVDVIDKHSHNTNKAYTTFIPGTIHIYNSYYAFKRIMIEEGIAYRFNSAALPYFYAKLHYLAGKKKTTDIACNAGYGEYGGFRVGLDFKAKFLKHFSIRVSNPYIISNLFKEDSIGLGFYAMLSITF